MLTGPSCCAIRRLNSGSSRRRLTLANIAVHAGLMLNKGIDVRTTGRKWEDMKLLVTHENWYRTSVSTEMEYLAGFVELTEVQIRELPLLREKHTEEINPVPDLVEDGFVAEEVLFGIFSFSIDHTMLVKEYFPDTIRKSTFVTIWGNFVTILKGVCRLMRKMRSATLEVRDLNGSELEQIAKYLNKVIGVGAFVNSRVWSDLNRVCEIRNLIVHKNGFLDKVNTEERKRILGFGELREEPDTGEIRLDEGFNIKVITTMNSFLILLESLTAKIANGV